MSDERAIMIADKIFMSVFGKESGLPLSALLEKFAFDVKLPKQVSDSITGEETWADSVNSGKYITSKNSEKRDVDVGWMLPKKKISSLQDLLDAWNVVNFTTTERVFDSIDVAKSDTIYNCENVYRCTSCSGSKNIVFCDSCVDCELVLASQRSRMCNYCIRCDDSGSCSNSYCVVCSSKISCSFFIQDCYDLYECIFCAHIASKKFCIANMQFEENEYFVLKKRITDWLLGS